MTRRRAGGEKERAGRPRVHGERAKRILEAALEMFAERGFDGTTTRDIAARAGVNLGLIPYYFGGKEKLWRAAVDRVFAALWEEVGGAVPDRVETREQLAQVLRVTVRFAARHADFVRLMNDEGKRNGPRMRWIADRHQKRLFELTTTLFADARRRGLVADVPPLHLHYILIGAVGMIFSQAPECRRVTGKDPTANRRMVETHAEAVVRTLLGPSDSC